MADSDRQLYFADSRLPFLVPPASFRSHLRNDRLARTAKLCNVMVCVSWARLVGWGLPQVCDRVHRRIAELRRLTKLLAFVVTALVIPTTAPAAETLSQALAAAYKFNPRLDAARSIQRATDEEVPRALSGYRPSITGSADTSYELQTTRPTGGIGSSKTESNPRGYEIGAVQPIFRGFRTKNAVSAAEATVRAGWEALRTTEASVLLEGVTAYMDVVRDQAILTLRENNVTVLTRDLKATQDRFAVGEVTRTDVAQAQARRAGAVAALDLARANLKTSRATFERVVGHPPSGLVEPRPSDAGAQEPGGEHRDRVAREPGRGCGAVPGAGGALQHRSDPGRAAADGAAGGQLRASVRCVGIDRGVGDDDGDGAA